MRVEIRELVKALDITSIYVTHDQEEALVLSDRIAVMDKGKVLQVGGPREVYKAPSDSFITGFVGEANLLQARVELSVPDNGSRLVRTAMGSLACSVPRHVANGETVTLMFRPHSLVICKDRSGHSNVFPGRIKGVAFVGSRLKCDIQIGSTVLLGEFPSASDITEGEEVFVEIPSNQIRVFVK